MDGCSASRNKSLISETFSKNVSAKMKNKTNEIDLIELLLPNAGI